MTITQEHVISKTIPMHDVSKVLLDAFLDYVSSTERMVFKDALEKQMYMQWRKQWRALSLKQSSPQCTTSHTSLTQ